MADPDLTFIGRQLERVVERLSSLEDKNRVLTAMVLRIESSMTSLLTEMHAVHTQIAP